MIQEANLHWRYFDTATNLIMPWYTLPALQWLQKQEVSQWSVFEYGSGYSTRWWAANGKYANSCAVDTSEIWAKAMMANHITEKKEYIKSCEEFIVTHYGWDCIVVDGDWREECVEFCIQFLKSGGYLIVDNYDSENFDPKKTEHLLKDWEVTIHKQPNHTSWKTAIFIKP